LLAAALVFAWIGPDPRGAWAQASDPLLSASPEGLEQVPQGTRPDKSAAAAPGPGVPLSKELERSEGVIVPADPGVDPGMVQPPPDAGAAIMPVIPPPGAPGGNPNIRPQ